MSTYTPKKGDRVVYNKLPCVVVFDEEPESRTCTLRWDRDDGNGGYLFDVHISRVKLEGDESDFDVVAGEGSAGGLIDNIVVTPGQATYPPDHRDPVAGFTSMKPVKHPPDYKAAYEAVVEQLAEANQRIKEMERGVADLIAMKFTRV